MDYSFTGIIVAVIVIAVIVALLGSTFFTVDTQTNVIVQRFGKFQRIAGPGLNLKIPFIDQKAGVVTLRVQQLDVKVETKTQDNVFTEVLVSVQYKVPEDAASVQDAFYKLSNPTTQITSYVFDSVRAKVPNMDLDAVFSNKDDIAEGVKEALISEMAEFGYSIVRTLVTDVIPDSKVKEAMNRINAAKRDQEAATFSGQANRIQIVARAQAESDSKKLQGEGIANQRKAIIDGLQSSVELLKESGIEQSEVLNLILLTQYFDTLTNLGASGATTILLPGSPSGLHDLGDQIRQSLISGGVAVNATHDHEKHVNSHHDNHGAGSTVSTHHENRAPHVPTHDVPAVTETPTATETHHHS